MREFVHTISFQLQLPEGAIELSAEVVRTADPAVFIIQSISFRKDATNIPFMTSFHMEKRAEGNSFQWYKQATYQPALICQSLGEAIERKLLK